MKLARDSLSAKLLLGIVPIVLTTVAAMGAWSYGVARDGLREGAMSQMRLAVDQVIRHDLARRRDILESTGIAHLEFFRKRAQEEALVSIAASPGLDQSTTVILDAHGQTLLDRSSIGAAGIATIWKQVRAPAAPRAPAQGEYLGGDRRYLYLAGQFAPWRWTIVRIHDAAALDARVQGIFTGQLAASATGALAIIVVLAWLLRRLVHRRIDGLVAFAARVETGDYLAATPIGGTDTIGRLASGMRDMVAAVRRHADAQSTLQDQVESANERLHQELDAKAEIEGALRAGEAQLRLIADAQPDVVTYIGTDERFEFANRAMGRWYGVEPAEVRGRTLKDVLGHDSYADIAGYLRQALLGEEVKYDLTRTLPSGDTIEVFERQLPERGPDGRVTGVVTLSSDITERKRLEAAVTNWGQRFRRLYRRSPVMLLAVGADGLIDEVTDYWLSSLGYVRNAVVGQALDEFLTPESIRLLGAAGWPALAARDGPLECDLEVRRADGTLRQIKLSALPEVDEHGVPVRVVAFMLDETERRFAEQALMRSEMHLRSVVDHVVEGIALFDDRDQLVLWNERYLEFNPELRPVLAAGIEFRAMVEATASVRVQQGTATSVEAYVDSRLADHRAPGRTLDRTRLDGGSHIIREARTTDGGTVLSVTDVTELKDRERDLERSNEELERFAYVASHDLQEPLRMITGYVQLLQSRYGDRFDDDGREFMGFAVDGAKRMQGLIQDLLKYSRLGTFADAMGSVSAGDALAMAAANLTVLIAENEGKLTYAELPVVVADEVQLTQLFQNLIGNAVKFRGDAPPRVEIAAVRDGAYWHFTVTDNGIGIAPAYQTKIFAVFHRLHTWDRYPGTGIGLALCQKIVERHGGRIWVESAQGAGATFHFTLPAEEAAEPAGMAA